MVDTHSELTEKEKRILELEAELQKCLINIDELKNDLSIKNEELNETKKLLEIKGDEKLSIYLEFLVEKLKERHDEAATLRLENKISEYTFTNLTFGMELAYLAKEAYMLVVKEAKGLFENSELDENTEENKEGM